MEKPFAPACERNRGAILNVLSIHLKDRKRVLEVGSGTGQHAIHFAKVFTELTWITSDVRENHHGIQMWLDEAQVPNIEGPISFKLGEDSFPAKNIDCIFTANTFHIMPWEMVEELIGLSSANLTPNSKFIIYGPFKYNGEYTSESNAQFDQMLRQTAPHQGIRDFKDVHQQFEKCGFKLLDDIAMPANNQVLIYTK